MRGEATIKEGEKKTKNTTLWIEYNFCAPGLTHSKLFLNYQEIIKLSHCQNTLQVVLLYSLFFTIQM